MTFESPSYLRRHDLRVFTACLLSFLLVTMPFMQIAAETGSRLDHRSPDSEVRSRPPKTNTSVESVVGDSALPGPVRG